MSDTQARGEGEPERPSPRFSRRTAVAGAAAGVIAVGAPLLALRSMTGEAQDGSEARLMQASYGDVSVFDFLNEEEAADVRGRHGRLDVTAACQRALNSRQNVFFPAGTYVVNADPKACLRPVGGQTITLDPAAVIQALPNALEQYQVLLIENVENVTVQGGTIVGERSAHRGTTGEHGMGIGIFGSRNVTVREVAVRECWGDGIYVGGRGFEGRSANVRIERCLCDGNRRQGLTIAAVDACSVIGGRFIRTQGTLPASGIDIEPNRDKPGATEILIQDADCSDNAGHGLTLSQVHTRDVKIVRLVAHRNGMSGISGGYPGGDVVIDRAECHDNGEHGIHIFGAKTYVSKRIDILSPDCRRNRGNGIIVGPNIDGFSIKNGVVADNGEHGLACTGEGGEVCDNGVIAGMHIHSNSQRSDRSFDNLMIGPSCHWIRIEDNDIDKGSGGRRPRYGVNVETDGAVTLVRNELSQAGESANARGIGKPKVVARGNSGLG